MNIKQEIKFNCNIEKLFEAMTDAKHFAELTGAPAEIEAAPGGAFNCFGGMISGQTIEIKPAKLLVQAWRVANWDAGVYSIVKFDFEKTGENETLLHFEHTGFPEDQMPHLDKGWDVKYWQPLKKFLEG